MELGDGMMSRNARILMVAVGLVVLGLGSGMAGPMTGAVIHGLALSQGSTGPEIHLRASGSLETVHYSPQPGVWVIDMPDASWPEAQRRFEDEAAGIEVAELSHVVEFGKRHSRLTVHLASPEDLEVEKVDDGLLLRFKGGGGEEAGTGEAAQLPLAKLPPVDRVASVAKNPPHLSLDDIEVRPVGHGVEVRLQATDSLNADILRLPAPDRLVLDFEGVVDRVETHAFPIGSKLIRRVRLAQHQGFPSPVTRLVVDMNSPLDYRFDPTESGAVLRVGSPTLVATHPEPKQEVVAQNMTISNLGTGGAVESVPAETHVADSGTPTATNEADEPAGIIEAHIERPVPEEGTATAAPNPWVADPHQLMEGAAAAQELDLPQPKESDYDTTEVETGEVQFTGDPITLTLKDADIKDVLKTFSALTHLNIVIDPEVKGTVTVELRDVPWDQALDIILKINGLDYVLENNVLRVSTVQKLSQEKADRAQYLKDQETVQPLRTVVKPLSYAKASEVKRLLSTDSYLMSVRGTVVVDARTNTLVIRDTIDRVDGVLRLIDTLDQPTPQVVIEGRIVETTKTFSKSLGVQWSFNSVNDAAHGNSTGLSFPSSITTNGGVNLGASESAAGFIGLSFGDILNTFNLDFLLSAAEAQGVAKIVSTPRVTTQNLKKARIRSGLQIPVQTVANNTVTVQYIDATLTLEVTPQITADGTVNLDVSIKKQQPLQAGIITGGNNAPIQTRDAQTELLVRDGGTTVIGGIYQIDNEDNRNAVPGLSKIPVLGALFRSHAVDTRHDELLIFITPRIVKY